MAIKTNDEESVEHVPLFTDYAEVTVNEICLETAQNQANVGYSKYTFKDK